jgi:hypothetical protein
LRRFGVLLLALPIAGCADDPTGAVSTTTATSRVVPTVRNPLDAPTPREVLRVQILKDYGLAKISAECRTSCESWTMTEIACYPAIHGKAASEGTAAARNAIGRTGRRRW